MYGVFSLSSPFPRWAGPGNGYNILTGRNASRALAVMELKEERTDLDGLTQEQMQTLERTFDSFVFLFICLRRNRFYGCPCPYASDIL